MSKNIRAAAFVSLMRIDGGGKYSNIELDAAIKRWNLEGADRALYTALVYGVIERKLTLDYQINRFLTREIDDDVRCVLRIAFFSILFLDRIPDHAAANEAVELCKNRCRRGMASASLVNAVIRSLLRDGSRILYPEREAGEPEYLSVRYSLPKWLCSLWLQSYGERAEQLMQSLYHPQRTDIAVNTLRADVSYAVSELCEAGCDAVAIPDMTRGVTIRGSAPIAELLDRFGGMFYVQDASSQRAAAALGAQPGEDILDACAAPGGKSFYIALDMANRGSLTSCDLHKNKLSLIEKTAASLGIDIISAREQNGAEHIEQWDGRFDRVICDVPCSGLGVIAKKPDLRYKSPDDIGRLPQIQLAIAENCSRYVKIGGTLLYSTCTLNAVENEENVRKLLEAHPELTLAEEKTFFPDKDGCDGFYYAKIQKH